MIKIRNLAFSYKDTSRQDTADFGIKTDAFDIPSGINTAMVGPSGSGKTTLLALIAGILRPGSGTIEVNGENIVELGDHGLGQFRIQNIGQVFQSFELLDYLSVLENVMLPWHISGGGPRSRTQARATALLKEVGLEERSTSRPGALSQGEQQRVAVCRAMLNNPPLLLADEPTGNLDRENKEKVVDILLDQARQNRSTLVMVTHDESLLDRFDSVQDIRAVTRSSRAEATS